MNTLPPTIPVTASIADAAAALKAAHNLLSVPDAVTLAVADAVGADAVWTFDRRWAEFDARVGIPGGADLTSSSDPGSSAPSTASTDAAVRLPLPRLPDPL